VVRSHSLFCLHTPYLEGWLRWNGAPFGIHHPHVFLQIKHADFLPLSGEPDKTIPLPDTADLVQCDEAQCDDLVAYIATISPALAAAPVKAKQACYLPQHKRFGAEAGPLVGRAQTPGLWVASGHTCWGIQNGPATGCLMAEMLLDGAAKSADVDRLDPRKFKV
jgi:glycine/D-amino acid oxidase-like deaminating enzyme